MNRQVLERWAAGLSPERFSAALLALARFGPMTRPPGAREIREAAGRHLAQGGHVIPVTVHDVAAGAAWIADRNRLMAADKYAALWDRFAEHLAFNEGVIIELDPQLDADGDPSGVDVFWLLRQFGRPEHARASAYLREERWSQPVGFELPLRFGLSADTQSAGLERVVEQGRWRELFRVVRQDDPSGRCDLLLMPCDLRTAQARLQAELQPLHAEAVVVMRGAGGVDTERALRLADSIRHEARAGAVAILTVPADHDAVWIDELVFHLAHDTPLVSALAFAQRRMVPVLHGVDGGANVPIVIASSLFARAARFREFARRLEAQLRDRMQARDAPPGLREICEEIGVHVRDGTWLAETAEATAVARARARYEALVGAPIVVRGAGELMAGPPQTVLPPPAPKAPHAATANPRNPPASADPGDFESMPLPAPATDEVAPPQPKPAVPVPRARRPGSTRAKPPAPSDGREPATAGAEPAPSEATAEPARETAASAPDPRRVIADVYDAEAAEVDRPVTDRLAAGRLYRLRMAIAARRDATLVATAHFPAERLAPDQEHELVVHFVPLQVDADGNPVAAQSRTLMLPVRADSGPCDFVFSVPKGITTYRARLIVSHRNRVLQTLILSAPVGRSKTSFRLDVENLVDPSFDHLDTRRHFDAALIVNHSPAGVAGVTAVRDGVAVFAEPVGLDKLSTLIRDFIQKEIAEPDPKRKYDNKQLQRAIYTLSRYGRALWNELQPKVKALLDVAPARIQIVDARAGAYFPAEFVCPSESPSENAVACPYAVGALQSLGNTLAGAGAGTVGDAAAASVAYTHGTCPHRDDTAYLCPSRMWGFHLVLERQPPLDEAAAGFLLRALSTDSGSTPNDVLQRVLVSVSDKVLKADPKAVARLTAALGAVSADVVYARDWQALQADVAARSPTLLVLIGHTEPDDLQIETLELGGQRLALDRLEPRHVKGPAVARPVVLLLACNTASTEIEFLNFTSAFKRCQAGMVLGTVTQIEARRTVAFVERFAQALAAAGAQKPTFGELLLGLRRAMLAGGDGYALSLLAYGDSDANP